MADTGWLTATTITVTMTGNDWVNPPGVITLDGETADCASPTPSKTLKIQFGTITIPEGATVTGVEVRWYDYLSAPGTVTANVKIVVFGASYTQTSTATSDTPDWRSIGGENDTWHLPSIAKFLMSSASMNLWYSDGSGPGVSADAFQVKVYYTEPEPEPAADPGTVPSIQPVRVPAVVPAVLPDGVP